MAQAYQTFSDWYTGFMNWLLKQTDIDDGDADKYKRLDVNTAIYVLNMAIDSLVLENQERYKAVISYVFDEDTKYLDVPHDCAKLIAYADSDDTSDDWHAIPGPRERGETIRKINDNQIYNSDGWTRGQKIDLLCVQYPISIKGENDIIYFPRSHWELLNLTVVNIVKYQSGQAMPGNMVATYNRLLMRWKMDTGIIEAFTATRLVYSSIGEA